MRPGLLFDFAEIVTAIITLASYKLKTPLWRGSNLYGEGGI